MDGPLNGRKRTKIIKTDERGKLQEKIFKINHFEISKGS
jgi:hypothetical protein